ncbi:MAG: TIGR03013 family XrtA/PEP-CTERM system glycosyltransferase [Gammaproteobacteria bacterium]
MSGGQMPETMQAGKTRFFSHATRFFQYHLPTEYVLLGLIEYIALYISFYLGLFLRFHGTGWEMQLGDYDTSAFVYSLIMQLSLIAFGAYQRRSRQQIEMVTLRIAGSLCVGMVAQSLTFYMFPMLFLGRGVIGLAFVISFVLVMSVRLAYQHIEENRDLRLRVLVLGSGKNASLIRNAQSEGMLDGVYIAGFVPMQGDEESSIGSDVVNPQGSLINYVADHQIDQIVLAADERRKGLPVQDLLDCKMSGIEVIDLPSFFERETGQIRLDILQPSWLFLSEGFGVSTFRLVKKRIFDITIVFLLLPLVLPVMLLSAVAILLDNKGKGEVLYRQLRVGKDGQLFKIFKFRSMVVDAEKDGKARWASTDDERVTRVGAFMRKYRLDELPQFFNILKGEMSFVGPRPERPEFVQELAENIPYYNERHRVKPGLTGWAQIRYPYGASIEDGKKKFQYDLYYVKNYSNFFDAFVLLQTADTVLFGRGSR